MLTGAKQTMSAWTKVIESYEDVPPIYKDFFKTRVTNNQQFPFTLLAPSLVKPKGKTTEKLVYDTDDAIHILEQNGSQVATKSYPYRTICTLEVGSILLSSWLTISGINSTGAVSVSKIDFNTSGARHYETFMNKLRPASVDLGEPELNAEKDKFNYLSALNFKLMNYGRSSLIHGDAVLQIILQPEIKEPIWAILGSLFQRMITPAHLAILTNHELILIEDIGRGRKSYEPRYGGIWQYIPLRSIRSAAWSETANDWLTLLIAVSPDITIEKIFAASNKPELERLCNELQKMIGESHVLV
jgi:hypothetical protein